MGAHEAPDTVLTLMEADWLRAYAAQLARELPAIAIDNGSKSIWAWAGEAQFILEELGRG